MMGCNCKDFQQEIQTGKDTIAELRELFINRMTLDSDHNDRRRKDYNRAIFFWFTDEREKTPETALACWTPFTMDLVLKCFDDAAKDWRKQWCDTDKCRGK